MRIILMHNPTAGRGKHDKQELMAALAKAGHHAIYQSTKKSDYKKVLKKSTDLVLVAGGDGAAAKIACRLLETGLEHCSNAKQEKNSLEPSWGKPELLMSL